MKKVDKRRKKKGINNTKALVVVLVAVVLFIGVAYAALQAVLTVTTTSVNSSGISWSVGFNPGTVNGTKGGTSTGDITCGAATVQASSVSVASTTLSKPDDSCTYALVIKNTGDIAATLGTIKNKKAGASSYTDGATFTDGNYTYGLYTNTGGTTPLTTGGTLAKTNGTLNVYLVIKYTGTSVSESPITQSGASFQITYNQA